jgi:hypothetical protein
MQHAGSTSLPSHFQIATWESRSASAIFLAPFANIPTGRGPHFPCAARIHSSAARALQDRGDDIEKSVDHAHTAALLETGDVSMGTHIGAGDRESR